MATVHGNVLHMGPAGDQWHYHRKERLYDLTRGSREPGAAQGLAFRTTAGPPDTRIAVAPDRTAFVIVDMQNFFLHRRCRDHPTGRAAVAPTLAAVEACRRAGIRIIWLNWGLTDADLAAMPASITSGFSRLMALDDNMDRPPPRSGLGVERQGDAFTGPWLVKGAWNSHVYEGEEVKDDGDGDGSDSTPSLAAAVCPALGDVLCDKTRMSGMWSETESLRQYLMTDDDDDETGGKRIRTLLFAGVNTDQCVLGTLTDAYNAGWDCVAVADCCATTTPGAQEVTMLNIANNLGFVIDSKSLIKGVDAYCEAAKS